MININEEVMEVKEVKEVREVSVFRGLGSRGLIRSSFFVFVL